MPTFANMLVEHDIGFVKEKNDGGILMLTSRPLSYVSFYMVRMVYNLEKLETSLSERLDFLGEKIYNRKESQ